jgi:hypothetical protein
MAGGGPGPAVPLNLFEARLRTNQNGTTNTLELLPYKGNRIEINRRMVRLPGGGFTQGVGSNLITAAGADSGAAGAASTLYYVYVSNALATFSPSSIRLSATAPSVVNGVRYLGAAGNALNWRFVGWVKLNATPNFESSDTSRFIVNYYNRLILSLFNCPGYVDNNTQAGYATSSVTWVGMNGGAASKLNFIANGEDAVSYEAIGAAIATNGQPTLGVGEGSSTTAKKSNAGFSIATAVISMSVSSSYTPPEGATFLDLLVASPTGAAVTFIIDFARTTGDAADPAETYISAQVMG